MTPEEINQAVAKRLGWHGIYTSPFEREYLGTEVTNKTVLQIGEFEGRVRPIPNYCGDIRAAWELVEKAEYFCILKPLGNEKWKCDMGTKKEIVVAWADTEEMAIVLAFLRLK